MRRASLSRALTGSIKRKILLTNGIILILMIGGSHLATYLHWRGQLTRFAQDQGWAQPLIEMGYTPAYWFGITGVFFALLLVGFVYEWRKGLFKWN